MTRAWDIQITSNWWLSLGIHIDHTDPSITLHLPGLIIYAGHCVQPGFGGWSLRSKNAMIIPMGVDKERSNFVSFVTGLLLMALLMTAISVQGAQNVASLVCIQVNADGTFHSVPCADTMVSPSPSAPVASATSTPPASATPVEATPTLEQFPTPSPLPTTTATALPTVTPPVCTLTAAGNINAREKPGGEFLFLISVGTQLVPDARVTWAGLLYYRILLPGGTSHAWAADFFTESGNCGGLPTVDPF